MIMRSSLTRAVARLSISWPHERQEAQKQKASWTRASQGRVQLHRWGLPFFLDLHNELCKLWNSPYSSHVSNPPVNYYSNIKEKDRAFLFDDPISPSGLFGDTSIPLSTGFKMRKNRLQYLPCRSRSKKTVPSGQLQQSMSSSTYRQAQKESVTSWAPPAAEAAFSPEAY